MGAQPVQTKLPSFLQKSGAKAEVPATTPDPAPKPAIFRAKPPELTVVAPQLASHLAAVQAKRTIFQTRPPVLVRPPAETAPAKPPRAPRAAAAPRHPPLPGAGGGFRVVPLQRLAQGGRWRTEAMRSYSAPILLWFTRGQGRITVAGVTRGFGAHNAVFLPAGTMHGFEVTAQVFGSALFFPLGTDLPLPEAPQHLRFRDATEQAELTAMIDNMQREIERDLPEAKRAVELHAGLLSVWLERQLAALDAPEAREPAAKRLSSAYSALVEKEFRSGKTVAAFAAQLGVTPTHLTRSCNAACGHSAHEILADRIFFEARRLLRDTRMPVKEVAESLGFHSPAYFTRAFQKVAGETPTAFRKHR